MQQQNQHEDYRYVYRHLAPYELTGIHAHYDMAHELGRGTFATVMKAMSRTTSDWWAVKIIHSQKLRGANANNNDNAARNNSGHLQNLGREISILEKLDHPNICRLRETFVPEDGGHDFCELFRFVLFSSLNWVSIFFFGRSRIRAHRGRRPVRLHSLTQRSLRIYVTAYYLSNLLCAFCT